MNKWCPPTEYTDIHYILVFCNGKSKAAYDVYCRHFPNCQIPEMQVFIDTCQRLLETQTVVPYNQEYATQQPFPVEDRILDLLH
jgi:hypothetical protein